MKKFTVVLCLLALLSLGSGYPTKAEKDAAESPVHIIRPPIRCPEGMKPDANGRCRKVWGRSIDDLCLEGVPDEWGDCVEADPICPEGEDCGVVRIQKREVQETVVEDSVPKPEVQKPGKKSKKMKLRNLDKKSRKARNGEAKGESRSKHALLIMLKKKKMQMMKPKPPPPPPPHHPHPPPHHHHPESEEAPAEEEEAPAEDDPAPARLFFADDPCVAGENKTETCPQDAEMVEKVESNNDFKEWKPPKSSESSESSDSSSSSSSSVSESESGSEPASGEGEDEILEKAIRVKLMKIFKMKQRYGPALRRWLVDRLREYEDRYGVTAKVLH